MLTNLLLVFTGGGLGSLARFGVSEIVSHKFATQFPLATLLSNVLSCVVLGLALGLFSDRLLEQPWLRLLVVVGFCGGFSTFSTFSSDTLSLVRAGYFGYAAGSIVMNLLFCFFILFLLIKKTPTA